MSKLTGVSIYPIFEECGKYTLDPFWKDRFSELSHNVFPKGLTYEADKHRFLVSPEGQGKEYIPLPKKGPECFKKVLEVLRERMNIRSERELNAKQGKETLSKHDQDLKCEFKDIKPRHIKDQLIMNYATELKKKHQLTQAEFTNLISTIQIGFQFKALGIKDVVYKDGVVLDITGLEFNQDTRSFDIPEIPQPTIRSEKPQTADRFCSAVTKYLKSNDARRSKFI